MRPTGQSSFRQTVAALLIMMVITALVWLLATAWTAGLGSLPWTGG
jgi:hypothetical protein